MLYRFEDYVLDGDRRELWQSAALLSIEPQVFDVLLFLVSNRNRLVSKEDLLNSVWGGRIVSESTLASRINGVRRVLGDSGKEQRLIRTTIGKGVRFVGPVYEDVGVVSQGGKPVDGHELKPSIAVLPFQNISGDPEQEYFVDGTVEEIIAALSRIRWFVVIARNSSFTYKGKAIDVKRVGRELGVRYVLEGSVRKSVNRVRISCQLVDATTGANIWTDRFDRNLEDIFELQDQIASRVAGAIEPQLRQSEIEKAARKPTESVDAYDLYLRALAQYHRWSAESLRDKWIDCSARRLHSILLMPQRRACWRNPFRSKKQMAGKCCRISRSMKLRLWRDRPPIMLRMTRRFCRRRGGPSPISLATTP